MEMKLERLKRLGIRGAAGAAMVTAPALAFAAAEVGGGGSNPVDLSAIGNAISFTQVGLAIAAVAASLALIYVGVKGAKIVLGFIRG